MTRSILRFQNNVAVTVKLDRGPEGKETQSKINNELQWMYTCDDDSHVIYLTANARAQLLRTGAQAGDTVSITKITDGKSTSWRVEVLSDAHEPEPKRRPADAPYTWETDPTRELHEPGPRMVAPRSNGYANGAPAVAAPPQTQTIPTTHPIQERMSRMFIAAGASLRDAHKSLIADPFYSDLEPPTWEDIRSVAIHWAISMERKAERTQ